MKHDPQMAQAASSLCVLLAGDRLKEAVNFCRVAAKLRPDDPKVAYTLAFYLHQKGETAEARAILKAIIESYPQYQDAQLHLRGMSATGKHP